VRSAGVTVGRVMLAAVIKSLHTLGTLKIGVADINVNKLADS